MFVIGAAKAGTTSLCSYLSQHPDIFFPVVKEPHYFSYQEKWEYSNGPTDKERIKHSTSNLKDYLDLFKNAQNCAFLGDGSTTYLDSAQAPHSIRDFAPKAKIVVILRNPVDRAFASFLHLRREGVEKCSKFEEALELENYRINKKYSVLWHYTQRQFTSEKLENYYKVFSRAQIKVFEYESWKEDNLGTLKSIFAFLEIEPMVPIDITKKQNVGAAPRVDALQQFFTTESVLKNISKYLLPQLLRKKIRSTIQRINFHKPLLNEQTRERLLALYVDDIKKTQDIAQINLSHWLITK